MKNIIPFLLIVLILPNYAYICQGKINQNPILNIKPVLVKQVTHGSKYIIDNAGEKLAIVNLTGNAWQMGYAYGQLMKTQIRELVSAYFHYIYEHAEEEAKFIQKLPKFLQPLGRSATLKILRSILQLNELITRKYTPARFNQQIDGIALGAGIQRSKIVEVNMIPQYTKAGCSIVGVWGNSTKNNQLLQLRALDWDANAPINEYPAIIVYHSTQKDSLPFANIAWAGFVGSITGFSENIGISEKFRGQKTDENLTRFGKPWNYALRDTLQFTDNIDAALQSLGYTDRTCSIYVGIGAKKNNTFRLVEYSYREFNVYDDTNFLYTQKHGQLDNIVYMPVHDDESECFYDLMQQNYGQIDQQWIMNVLAPLHRTGNTQLAVYNFETKQLLLQYSRNGIMAYERSPLRIDLGQFY